MIQDSFQRQLNAMAPTAGHQGYAPALPFQQNALGALANNDSDDNSAATVATQMAALTYQSQIMANTAANLSQRMDQYVQTLAHQQGFWWSTKSLSSWLPYCSTRALQAEALDAKGAVLPHRPCLPQSSSKAKFLEAVADKDMDVDEDANLAAARPHLLRDVHPLS
jgi:hypothetical protein